MDNLGPFALKKAMGAKREIGPLMVQWDINLGPFDDKMDKLETLAMMKFPPPPDDLKGKLGALDQKFFSNC